MKKLLLISLSLLLLVILTGCGIEELYDSSEVIEIDRLVGTWETSNSTESVTLKINEDGTFEFIGTGLATEDEEEVTLTETGVYEIEGNRLTLDIQDVTSTGLTYAQYTADELGDLKFYVEFEDNDTKLSLVEVTGSVTYILEKQGDQ